MPIHSANTHLKKSRHQPTQLSIQQQLEVMKLIFDHIDNGACVVDPDGFITHFNKPYGRFLGVDPEEQIGRHVTEVIEGSRMGIVARTGKAEINASHPINGQKMVVQRIPIKENGKVIAVYGQVMFKDIKEVSTLAAKLSELRSKVRYYQNQLNSLRTTRYTFENIIGISPQIRDLIAEQFCFQEILGDCSTIQSDERAIVAVGCIVNRLGEQFLAGA